MAEPTKRTYRLTVYAAVPLEDGEPSYSPKDLEKHLMQVLRKAEPDCDLEVMDFADSEE